MQAHPGAKNMVPGRAALSVEVRSPGAADMSDMHRSIAQKAENAARD